MTNPDERPAAEQFGTGDKAFASARCWPRCRACRCSAMARSRASASATAWSSGRRGWDEPIDEGHVAHFERPSCRSSGAGGVLGHGSFRLYDALATTATSSRTCTPTRTAAPARGDDRSLVLVHHRHAERRSGSTARSGRRGGRRRRAPPSIGAAWPRHSSFPRRAAGEHGSGSSTRAPAGRRSARPASFDTKASASPSVPTRRGCWQPVMSSPEPEPATTRPSGRRSAKPGATRAAKRTPPRPTGRTPTMSPSRPVGQPPKSARRSKGKGARHPKAPTRGDRGTRSPASRRIRRRSVASGRRLRHAGRLTRRRRAGGPRPRGPTSPVSR